MAVGNLLGGIASNVLGGLVGANFGNISTYANVGSKVMDFLESVEEAVGGNSTINPLNGLPDNQGYESFYQLKKAIGSAGTGMQWHHIVEQSQMEKSGFSAQQIHNTSNIIAIEQSIHKKITGYYNTKTFDFTGGLSVRDWLAGQSFEFQYEFGLEILRMFGVID